VEVDHLGRGQVEQELQTDLEGELVVMLLQELLILVVAAAVADLPAKVKVT
jgi:hypothetical protein